MTSFRLRTSLPQFGIGALFGGIITQVLREYYLYRNEPEIAPSKPEAIPTPHYPLGFSLPSDDNVVVQAAFTSSHNYRTKCPNWVAEVLTAESVSSKVGDRKRATFKPNSDVPERFRASNKDYWDSGWSRGHLAAAGTHRGSQEAQDSTFLLNSNIVPQDLSMNGCDWNRLEVLVRDLTKEFPNGKVYVLSGPVWVPETGNGITRRPFGKNKIILHEVVGEHSVHVPTHMFKIIRVEDASKQLIATAAFLMPNRPILKDEPLEKYLTDIPTLEKHTGLNITGMSSDTNLCGITRCDRGTNRRMHGWRHYGFIDEARDVEELQSAIRKAVDDGFVDGDNFLIAKAVRDRMNDLGLNEDAVKLFPFETRYQEAVQNGLENFRKRPVPTDAQ